jgi:hypothetical protein
LKSEYAQALETLQDTEAQRNALATLPVRPSLQPVDRVLRAVRRTVARIHSVGVEAELYTAAPTTLTRHSMTVPAIPCRLVLRAETLLAVVEAVQAVERHQIVTQQWRLLPGHEAELRFYVVGIDGTAPHRPLSAPTPQEGT